MQLRGNCERFGGDYLVKCSAIRGWAGSLKRDLCAVKNPVMSLCPSRWPNPSPATPDKGTNYKMYCNTINFLLLQYYNSLHNNKKSGENE